MREIIVSEYVALDGVMEDLAGRKVRTWWLGHTLSQHDLIDEYRLLIYLVCGKWKTTF